MKNKVIISIFTSILYFSCDDVLDVQPENYLFEEQLVTNDKSAQTSLVGAYTELNDFYLSQYLEIVVPLFDGSLSPNSTGTLYTQSANNSFVSSSVFINFFYEGIYSLINAANATITNVSGNESVSESERDRILGEAYFLRAYGHFRALRLFGQFYDLSSPYGIVLKEELSTVANSQITRSTVQESYDFILNDLDESIIRNAAFTYNYYASSTASKAFKANILLYIGGDANYAEAITLADEVINSGDVVLESNFEDIFINGEVNSEVIFARVVGEGQIDKYSFIYQSYVLASEWIQGYLLNDPREAYTYNDSNNRIKKVYDADVDGMPTNFMRLAEVYLIKAECQARLNLLTEAEASLNIIRNRAYGGSAPDLVYTTQEELLDLIFDEYVKELCFEASSVWFAEIRHGKVEEIKPDVASTDQYILPIPLGELETNLVFGEQNPGYDGL